MLSALHKHVATKPPEKDESESRGTGDPAMRKLLLERAMMAMESPEAPMEQTELLCMAVMEIVEPELDEAEDEVFDRERFKAETAKMVLERREELLPIQENNPWDDQEKVDEVRRQVFGSAPE
jgi:hypothetical protein